MDYARGYKVQYYAVMIDPQSWVEGERLELISGSVNRTDDELRQSASITVSDYEQQQEHWIRIYMDARQNDDVTHEALFTGLATSPKKAINGNTIKYEMECFSVLKPLQDIVLQRGWYVPIGANVEDSIKALLSYTPAVLELGSNTPSISDYIIAEDDETALSMLDKILKAIKWTLKITGEGHIQIMPESDTSIATFGARAADILETSVSVERDWYECPNVFRASTGDVTAVARDDDPNSILSTVSRGREVIMSEDDVTLGDNEGIAEYARRRLREEQDIAEKVSYTRRYVPGINVGDVITLDYEQAAGIYRITSQTINLTHGGKTSEEVKKLI